jgi:NAD(P)-dependent dehydrogenase (short-subunit alcohol dehydrogenase family)
MSCYDRSCGPSDTGMPSFISTDTLALCHVDATRRQVHDRWSKVSFSFDVGDFFSPNCSEERLKRAAQALSAATGNDCLPVKADVRDPRQIQAAVQQTIARYGRIDFVINGMCNKYSSLSNAPMTTAL